MSIAKPTEPWAFDCFEQGLPPEEEVIASKACVIHYRKFGGLYILSNMQQKTISIEKYLSVKMVILHCSVAYLKIRTHLLLVLLLLFFLLLLSLFCI